MNSMKFRVLCTVLLMGATPAQAEESQSFSNTGFAFSPPAHWHARKISQGIISASTTPESPIHASAELYFGVIAPTVSEKAKAKFHAGQKKRGVRNYVSKGELKRSRWHSEITTEKLADNVSVEKVEMEILQRVPGGGKQKKPVCRYFRQYHAPLAELQLTYSQQGTCAQTKRDFESFASGLKWNN